MKAKKSLGQNFLKSESALRKITEVAELNSGDTVLEIGPGKGALTEKLLEETKTVIAVEKDDELFEFLQNKFAAEITTGSLVLIHEDILSEAILVFVNGLAEAKPRGTEDLNKNLKLRNYKIVANIPYNLTGAILKKFLTATNQPESMTLMLQQEVAQRIVARNGKESLLSISVKAYGVPKLIMKVPARYFSPKPKVDSSIIAIKDISRRFFLENSLDEEKFWQIVKAGFAHKRKKLASNLKIVSKIVKRETLQELGNKRAENLTLDDWVALIK